MKKKALIIEQKREIQLVVLSSQLRYWAPDI